MREKRLAGKWNLKMYIGLISDTHGVFDEQFSGFFEPVDVIWHCGDFGGGEQFVRQIEAVKPVVGVCGNCDGQEIRYRFPGHQLLEIQGLKLLMTHIAGSPDHYYPRALALIDAYKPDILLCGHSHILKVMYDKQMNLMYINPGAAGLQGWQVERTALRFKIEDGSLKDMEVLRVPRQQGNAF